MFNYKAIIYKSIISFGVFFIILSPVSAQVKIIDKTKSEDINGVKKESIIVDVWTDGKMPPKGANEPETDMPSKGDGVQRITNVSRPTLTIFPAKNKNAPAMIVCPGGGYSYVTYNKEGTEIADWLNANGITAVVLKYRVPNNRQGALQDIQRSLSLVRANAGRWNVDPKRLGVIGFSAGGNLAAKASNLFDQRSYPEIDEIDKQSMRPDFVIMVYPAYLEKDGQIAADLNLKAKIPPTLIVSTEDDKTFVNSGKIYHTALDEAKVPNEFLLYPTGGHGFGLRSTKDAKAWSQAALDWLSKIGIKSAISTITPAQAETLTTKVVFPPAKENFQIYLLMGQSNMVGRDTGSLDSQIDNPHVLALNAAGQWVIAREPMHVGGTGIGPGIPFAIEMLKTDPKATIGLVPCAVGGTPLRRWIKGADLYEQCLNRVKLIIPAGTISGVLWHQGESDTNSKENAETYEIRLSHMLKDLRTDLGLPNLPIVVGQIGDFLTTEKYPFVEDVRKAIKQIPNTLPKVGYASSTGLIDKGDKLHFSADAEREFGTRFARSMRELQK